MCLGIPGKIVKLVEAPDPLFRQGEVQFGPVSREVSLACVPEAKMDDYVLVHAGMAIAVINEQETHEILELLSSVDEISE